MIIELTHISNFAYKMANVISQGNHTDVACFEFHIPTVKDKPIYDSNGLNDFRDRSEKFYENIIAYAYPDEYEANIGVAIKLMGQLYYSLDCGSNYYRGYGPSGIIAVREACNKKSIPIVIIEDDFNYWFDQIYNAPNFSGSYIESNDERIEASEFERIIRLITSFSSKIQDVPDPYSLLSEEQLRDVFLQPLNQILEGRAHGESKISKGKTDILIKSIKGEQNYIFELKKWSGLAGFDAAIDQLRGYLNWDDKFSGAIFFCYQQDFGSILKKVKEHISINYVEVDGYSEHEREFRVRICHENDSIEKVEVHLLFINLKIKDRFDG